MAERRNSLLDFFTSDTSDDLTYRSSMLPIGTYRGDDGTERAGLAWPQLAMDAVDAMEAPGELLFGEGLDRDESQRRASIAAGLMMGGGLAAPRPGNALARSTEARTFSPPGSGETLFANGSKGGAGVGIAEAASNPKPMTAWHGSPHDFDKFSLDKVGTGEGNQAFGHGAYLASNEDVAKYYRDTLVPEGGGYMYEVKINAPEETFLDMSRPLSEQSDIVRNALMSDRITEEIRKRISIEDIDGRYLVRSPSGSTSARSLEEAQKYLEDAKSKARADYSYADYNAPYLIGREATDPQGMAKALRESGISGAKYYDQHSRLANEGNQTMNYVVYDDSVLDILHKWRGDEQLYANASPSTGLMSLYGYDDEYDPFLNF